MGGFQSIVTCSPHDIPLLYANSGYNNIYNFDETSFSMSIISTAKVVTGSESRGWPKVIQPENQNTTADIIISLT